MPSLTPLDHLLHDSISDPIRVFPGLPLGGIPLRLRGLFLRHTPECGTGQT